MRWAERTKRETGRADRPAEWSGLGDKNVMLPDRHKLRCLKKAGTFVFITVVIVVAAAVKTLHASENRVQWVLRLSALKIH